MKRFPLCLLLMGGIATAAMAQPADDPDVGAAVYNKACKMCHATGMMNAPRLGDRDAWVERIAKGRAALLESTLSGLNRMPARGGCTACSEDELSAALAYLLEHSQ